MPLRSPTTEWVTEKKKKKLDLPGGLEVRDSALPLLWLRFNPWPRNFCTPQVMSQKKRGGGAERKPKGPNGYALEPITSVCWGCMFPPTAPGNKGVWPGYCWGRSLETRDSFGGNLGSDWAELNSAERSRSLRCFYLPFFFFVFLGPHPQHMEVPRLGVELEL